MPDDPEIQSSDEKYGDLLGQETLTVKTEAKLPAKRRLVNMIESLIIAHLNDHMTEDFNESCHKKQQTPQHARLIKQIKNEMVKVLEEIVNEDH